MTRAVRVHDVPADLRALAEPHDYVDMFIVTTPHAGDVTAEQWARATIESASSLGRFLAWRAVCELQLGPDDCDHIGGWHIADRGHGWIRLVARSWFMSAQMLFHADGDRVAFLTLVRYERTIGRAVWSAASVIHRAVAPDFLRGGLNRIESQLTTAG
ncbi:MAG: hypothetical protein QOI82_2941 [Actinomycetota bacterium]|jgi:hypothetical protein|nr:hypothetical protein [Actinomycetota bacterium]